MYIATVVNNSGNSNSAGYGMRMILGVIVILAIAFLFFVYGLPMISQSAAPQVNVPGKIDVNVQNGPK